MVTASVWGISATEKPRASGSTTVSETPSTATEPLGTICRASSRRAVDRAPAGPRRRRASDADRARPVDVTLHDVPVEAGVGAHRALEVERIAGLARAERRAAQGLGHRLEGEHGPIRKPVFDRRAAERDAMPATQFLDRAALARAGVFDGLSLVQNNDVPGRFLEPGQRERPSSSW